ncbi:MAG: GNAT family N-acetyltransferase [Rhizobiales bacterium]|nr:GNAT family N-acetyltransferase [Hyphomicrobiales bacterium]
MIIEPIAPDDEPAVLALNNRHAEELSLLDPPRLSHLLAESFHARRVGSLDAFLIAFDETAGYDSPNFLWFRERYDRFAYVDRIAVAARARGRGLASLLYEDLFARARTAGHRRIVCEVNSDPPNPASDAFHASFGFREVGNARLPDGKKTVRYFERSLTP